jgi:hypothetical protein
MLGNYLAAAIDVVLDLRTSRRHGILTPLDIIA